jgi:hypothetical protein
LYRPNGLEEERQTDPKEHRPTDPDEQRPTDPVEQIHTEPEEQQPTDNANARTFSSPCSKKRKKAHRRIANKLTLMFFDVVCIVLRIVRIPSGWRINLIFFLHCLHCKKSNNELPMYGASDFTV